MVGGGFDMYGSWVCERNHGHAHNVFSGWRMHIFVNLTNINRDFCKSDMSMQDHFFLVMDYSRILLGKISFKKNCIVKKSPPSVAPHVAPSRAPPSATKAPPSFVLPHRGCRRHCTAVGVDPAVKRCRG